MKRKDVKQVADPKDVVAEWRWSHRLRSTLTASSRIESRPPDIRRMKSFCQQLKNEPNLQKSLYSRPTSLKDVVSSDGPLETPA